MTLYQLAMSKAIMQGIVKLPKKGSTTCSPCGRLSFGSAHASVLFTWTVLWWRNVLKEDATSLTTHFHIPEWSHYKCSFCTILMIYRYWSCMRVLVLVHSRAYSNDSQTWITFGYMDSNHRKKNLINVFFSKIEVQELLDCWFFNAIPLMVCPFKMKLQYKAK